MSLVVPGKARRIILDASMFALGSIGPLQLVLVCVRVEYASHPLEGGSGPTVVPAEPVVALSGATGERFMARNARHSRWKCTAYRLGNCVCDSVKEFVKQCDRSEDIDRY